jgi:hypothetical protein
VKISTLQKDGLSGEYWIVFLSGLVWTAYVMVGSPGWEFTDELAHFYFSRDAWAQPTVILYFWGRPLQTLFFMPAALVDFQAARWFALGASGLTVVIASLWAKNLGLHRLSLVPLCLWFQPWFCSWAYTANTMTLFALLLVLGAYFISADRTSYAALLFGLLPLVRHEGLGLTLLLIAYLGYKRRYSAIVFAMTPLFIYNLAYYLWLGSVPYAAVFDYDAEDPFVSPLGGSAGLWLYYFPFIVREVGVPLLVAGLFSFIPIIRSGWHNSLPFIFFATYFAEHATIVRYGLFSGVRYYFYLVPLAPAFGIAAAIGFEAAFLKLKNLAARHLEKRLQYLPALTASIFAIIIVAAGLQAGPKPLNTEEIIVKNTAEWVEGHMQAGRPVYTTDIRVRHFLGESRPEMIPFLNYVSENWWQLDDLPKGAIFVWDQHHSDGWGYTLEKLMSATSGWRKLVEFGQEGEEFFTVIFENETVD